VVLIAGVCMCTVHAVGDLLGDAGLRLLQIQTLNLDSAAVPATFRPVARQLPPYCPSWVAYLNDCEVTDTNFMAFLCW